MMWDTPSLKKGATVGLVWGGILVLISTGLVYEYNADPLMFLLLAGFSLFMLNVIVGMIHSPVRIFSFGSALGVSNYCGIYIVFLIRAHYRALIGISTEIYELSSNFLLLYLLLMGMGVGLGCAIRIYIRQSVE